MVLIMSEYNDNSTIYVSQWLIHWGVPYVRIDLEETYQVVKMSLKNDEYECVLASSEGKIIDLNKISSVWYRRGDLNLKMPVIDFISNSGLKKAIENHLWSEKMTIESFFYQLMESKPRIGSFTKRSVNKLKVLREAALLGIEIPYTLIVSSKSNLTAAASGKLVSKGIHEGFKHDMEIGNYTTYTEDVDLNEMPEQFFPSLFQDTIEKEADIRSFYLFGKFYSMAIRSQSHDQTITDFRKYLKGIGNRSFPFKIPASLEEKLHQLMVNLGLETGSIDLVFTKDGRFVFLEVNPVGQFGMTSIPCNYYLEREIAGTLVSLAKN